MNTVDCSRWGCAMALFGFCLLVACTPEVDIDPPNSTETFADVDELHGDSTSSAPDSTHADSIPANTVDSSADDLVADSSLDLQMDTAPQPDTAPVTDSAFDSVLPPEDSTIVPDTPEDQVAPDTVVPDTSDPCADMVCPPYASCQNGTCICWPDYEMGADGLCHPMDPCQEVVCPPNSSCVNGTCICYPDYEMGADGLCHPMDPCQEVVCPPNSSCVNGTCICQQGFEPDGQGGCKPVPACGAAGCGLKAWCDESAGVCLCKPGFEYDGSQCVPPIYVPPQERSQEEVCQRYKLATSYSAFQQHVGGDASQCIAGMPTREALNDALAQLNIYRWLAGLDPAWDVDDTNKNEQECALMEYLMGYLDHFPSSDVQCYTAAGAGAAGSSNLALGCSTLPCTIDLYIGDNGVSSLGHRRWCLNPSLGTTGFGIFGSASCMYSFGGGNSWYPEYVAYPSAGYYPSQLVHGVWSFSSSQYTITSDTTAEALLVDSGTVVPLTLENAGGSYGYIPTYKLIPASSGFPPVQLSGTVSITLYNLSAGGSTVDLQYTVKLITCN